MHSRACPSFVSAVLRFWVGIQGVYRVVLYRHPACRCDACDCLVQRTGRGELLGSRIGPNLRAKAVYLRNVIGISYTGTKLLLLIAIVRSLVTDHVVHSVTLRIPTGQIGGP